jgi:DnaJ-like protein
VSAKNALNVLDALAEARIEEAMRDGAFDDLPGAGRPLDLDDDRLVPEPLRAAYRILKNAGFVPPEIEARRERAALTALIARLDDSPARRHALAKLALLEAKLEGTSLRLRREPCYEAKLVQRLSRS